MVVILSYHKKNILTFSLAHISTSKDVWGGAGGAMGVSRSTHAPSTSLGPGDVIGTKKGHPATFLPKMPLLFPCP